MYNEAEGIPLFFSRLVPVLDDVTPSWEILCVNDGSRDATLSLLKERARLDLRVRYLSLSRNFGKESALSAGLAAATGEAVIPIDADLQDPPELIPEMVAKWREGYKVVLATRRTRLGDGISKRLFAGLFYRVFGALTSFDMPQNTGDFRLMDRQVVEEVRRLQERTRMMKGLFAWVGFSTTHVYFDREKRAAGASKLSFRSLWRLAKDGIFSFTTLPLRVCTWLGAVISLASFSYAAYLVIHTLLHGVDLPGYASLMTAILCMGGIQLLSIGIIGEYIGRIYRETKQRPLFIIEEQSA